MEACVQERTVHSMASQSTSSVVGGGVEVHVIDEGIFAQGIEEEAVPLVVLRGAVIEDDGHQSTKVLASDGLGMKRSSAGLCMGDDERTLGLAGVFSLCIGRCLLVLLPGDALCIGPSRWWRRQIGFTMEARQSWVKARMIHTMN
jgi:hypothetical protein